MLCPTVEKCCLCVDLSVGCVIIGVVTLIQSVYLGYVGVAQMQAHGE